MPGFRSINTSTKRRVSHKQKTLHSEMHLLTDEITTFCNEPKLFAQFLGRIKTVGLPVSYQAFSELKDGTQRRTIRQPGRWWMVRTKSLTKG